MTRPDWPFAAFRQPFRGLSVAFRQAAATTTNYHKWAVAGVVHACSRLRRIDGTSAGADVRIAAAAAAEAAPSARPRPRQSTNGSASSAARARADTRL